jgi:hypothetical protein
MAPKSFAPKPPLATDSFGSESGHMRSPSPQRVWESHRLFLKSLRVTVRVNAGAS